MKMCTKTTITDMAGLALTCHALTQWLNFLDLDGVPPASATAACDEGTYVVVAMETGKATIWWAGHGGGTACATLGDSTAEISRRHLQPLMAAS